MVKHTHHHTCESALFYNRSRSVDLIASQCPFHFYHNRSVIPSILDGGSQLVLANVKVGHSPTCDPQHLHTLPTSTYTLTSREILCNCTLQSDLAYFPSDLGACNATTSRIHFEERPNIAFSSIFQDLLANDTPPSLPIGQDSPFHSSSIAPDFPLNLTLPYNSSSSIHTLRDLHTRFAANFSSFSAPGMGYVLSRDYERKLNEMRNLIYKRKEKFISLESHVITLITWGMLTANLVITGLLHKKYQMLKTLTATLTMLKYSGPTMALSLDPLFTIESPSKAKVVCYDPIISGLLTFLSTMSVAIMMYQQWKNRNLCRGYLYNNTFEIKLVLGEDTHYLPLRIRKIVGHLHRVSINIIPSPDQIRLVRNWLWESVVINWDNTELLNGEEVVDLPSTVVVPLRAKMKVRQIMSNRNLTVSLALTQDNYWYHIAQSDSPASPSGRLNIFQRENRPLATLVNVRENSSAPTDMEQISNMQLLSEGVPPPYTALHESTV